MGYFVTLTEADWVIPETPEVLAAIHRMDTEWDAIKRGGSWGSEGRAERWFSWMPADLSTFTSVRDVFTNLGFETNTVDDSMVSLWGYDNKTGQEELFLAAVVPFVKDGSYTEWRGEDGSMWRYAAVDGRLVYQEAELVWHDGVTHRPIHYDFTDGKSISVSIDLYSGVSVAEQIAAAETEEKVDA